MRLFKKHYKDCTFFATFETEESKHDRYMHVREKLTNRDFFFWLNEKREEIENDTGRQAFIMNCKIIK